MMVCRSSWNPVDCATPMYPRCHGQIPAAVAPGRPVAWTILDSSPMAARSEPVPLRCEAVSWPRNGGVRGQRIRARAGPGALRCVGMGFGSRIVNLSGAAGGRGGGPGWSPAGNAGPGMPPPARRERPLDRQRRLDRSCRHALGRIALAHGGPATKGTPGDPDLCRRNRPAPMTSVRLPDALAIR
jgi:hypothetical protein